jgi:hypothetical protein
MYLTNHEKQAGTNFQLHPFIAGPMTENLSISGSLARRSGVVQIEYKVEGALDLVNWPTTSQVKGRCHELWRQSCFELFFAIKGDSSYWEVNLSPNDCWNVYYFTDYRAGMREEKFVGQPVCRVAADGDLLSLTCTLEIKGFIDDCSDLEVGVSSVLQTTDGSASYWAIDHCGKEPDFHNRSSFSVALPGADESNNE